MAAYDCAYNSTCSQTNYTYNDITLSGVTSKCCFSNNCNVPPPVKSLTCYYGTTTAGYISGFVPSTPYLKNCGYVNDACIVS